MTINKYVEAERGTALNARYGRPFWTESSMKCPTHKRDIAPLGTLNGVAMVELNREENRGFTSRQMEPSDEC